MEEPVRFNVEPEDEVVDDRCGYRAAEELDCSREKRDQRVSRKRSVMTFSARHDGKDADLTVERDSGRNWLLRLWTRCCTQPVLGGYEVRERKEGRWRSRMQAGLPKIKHLHEPILFLTPVSAKCSRAEQ
jgi:hypothetical protein